jgi:hypothetical protein
MKGSRFRSCCGCDRSRKYFPSTLYWLLPMALAHLLCWFMSGSRGPLYGQPSQRAAMRSRQYSIRCSTPSVVGDCADYLQSSWRETRRERMIDVPGNLLFNE